MTWSLVKKAGFLSLRAYLQAGFLLIAAFYDKSITWEAYTFLWGEQSEHTKKYNKSENFIT